MRVFLPLEAAGPMLTAIGFEEVKVDTSDSKMTLEVFQIDILIQYSISHKGGWG